MRLIIKNKIEADKPENIKFNFLKTENGYSVNGKEINIKDNFKENSYLIVFSVLDKLIYVDGTKLALVGIDSFDILRYAFKVVDYGDSQLLAVWYGSSIEDTTVAIHAPVSFSSIEQIDYTIKNAHNLEIFKEYHSLANDLLNSTNQKRQILKDTYSW
jgi:hypothetical protein